MYSIWGFFGGMARPGGRLSLGGGAAVAPARGSQGHHQGHRSINSTSIVGEVPALKNLCELAATVNIVFATVNISCGDRAVVTHDDRLCSLTKRTHLRNR
jgi:hypothetical protein